MAIHIEELIQIFGIKLLILFKARLTIPQKVVTACLIPQRSSLTSLIIIPMNINI